MTRRCLVWAILAASLPVVAGGCGAQSAAARRREWARVPGAFAPLGLSALQADALASAMMAPREIALPAGDRWPRMLSGGGPFAASVTLAPYVGVAGALADLDRMEAGWGAGASFGYRLLAGTSGVLEVSLAFETSAHHNPASDVDGTATRTLVAGTFLMKAETRTRPFTTAGVGAAGLAFDALPPDYGFEGTALKLGGGVEFAAEGAFSARVGLDITLWEAADASGGGGQTVFVGLAASAAFGF
jgi:hypothetical protein